MWQVLEKITVPPGEGRAIIAAKGDRIRLTVPKGHQAVDFFAFARDEVTEWLSPMHTWVHTRSLKPLEGQVFLSRLRNPMMVFEKDGADGIHDMLFPSCDAARYREFGIDDHRGCGENLTSAMQALGYQLSLVPQPINFFMHSAIADQQALESRANPVRPGAYVVLECVMDLICAASSCPWDLASPWSINAPGGPTEAVMEVLG